MAGEWIACDLALPEKPEVQELIDLTLAGPQANPRSLANFPCQAHGAEMLRLACCLLTEAGVRVCCPVHDAVMIEAPLDELDATIEQTKELMRQASAIVLGGEMCRVEADVVRWPDHFSDGAGADFWQTLLELAGPMPQGVAR